MYTLQRVLYYQRTPFYCTIQCWARQDSRSWPKESH